MNELVLRDWQDELEVIFAAKVRMFLKRHLYISDELVWFTTSWIKHILFLLRKHFLVYGFGVKKRKVNILFILNENERFMYFRLVFLPFMIVKVIEWNVLKIHNGLQKPTSKLAHLTGQFIADWKDCFWW